MWKSLTKNLGLKLVSLAAAFILWLVVVNVDDPIISRTYSGIEVEISNADVLTDQGKCYEVLENTDVINVVVTAKRSVLDEMSKDYIKATADFKSMTLNETVPIEVRSTRYYDRIESVTSRTANLKLELENLVERTVSLGVMYDGIAADGYVLASAEANVSSVTISGPESLVDAVEGIQTYTNIMGINKDVVASQNIEAVDSSGERITDSRLIIEPSSAVVRFTVNSTKEIPISCGYSGNPMNGYAVTGNIVTDPSSVVISGRGENFDDMNVIYIVPDEISVDGAMSDVIAEVDISEYLPSGVSFADKDFNPAVQVMIGIEPTNRKIISVPLSNITITGLPDGYVASVIDSDGYVEVEIQGLGDVFDRYSGDLAIGIIDAVNFVPKTAIAGAEGLLHIGENAGTVIFDLPAGITLVNPVNLTVLLDFVGNAVPLTSEGIDDANAEVGEQMGNSAEAVDQEAISTEAADETADNAAAAGSDIQVENIAQNEQTEAVQE